MIKTINTRKFNDDAIDQYFKSNFQIVDAKFLMFDYFKRPLQPAIDKLHWTFNTEMIRQVILTRTLRESDEAMYREMFRIVGLEIK